ncbi:MAG TPA: sugar transferase [Myxococcaceae bacterium]|nr:sugar transferase [Myxococcaceae bacterium]
MNSLGKLVPGRNAKINLILDLVLLAIAIVAARPRAFGLDVALQMPWGFFAAAWAWIITTFALRHYNPWAHDRALLDDAAMATVGVGAAAMAVAGMRAFTSDPAASPDVVKMITFLWPAVIILRVSIFRNMAKGEAGPLDEVLVIGGGPLGRATIEFLKGKSNVHVVGHLSFQGEKMGPHAHGEYLGNVEELESILRSVPVNEVYISGSMTKQGEQMQAAVRVCEKFGVPFALPANPFRFDRAIPVEQGSKDGYIHYLANDAKPAQFALKRLFDIVSSGAALFFMLPLFAVVAAAIKLGSKGPVFFRQQRIGLNGRPFGMLKFRSMVTNAEELKAKLMAQNEQTGPVFKMKNDPRITGIGRFIRKYSIDELPQLINVLRGDMSVVGPRPPVPSEVAKYEAWQRRRLSVRPGLTCIWQVSGRNQITFDQWMYLDMQYIDHWSFVGDLQLIFRTVPVVLTGRGAS